MYNKIEKLLGIFLSVLFITMFSFLFIDSLIYTGQNIPDKDEYIYFIKDHPLFNLIILISCFLLIYFLFWLQNRYQYKLKINTNIIALIVSVVVILISILWVLGSKTAPQADQGDICKYASAFNNGDCSSLSKGEYVSIYRHQLGLITIMRVFFKIFGDGNYLSFQIFSAIMSGGLVYFIYQIVKKITHHTQFAEILAILMTATFFPIYAYTPFVYGEISSTALLLLAAWMLLEYIDRFSWITLIIFSLSSILALQLRKNSLIVIISFIIILLIKTISLKRASLIIPILTVFLFMILANGILDHIYGNLVADEGDPMPAILHIAMGTNDDPPNPGWWNGYNWFVYTDNDCDVSKTSEIASNTITAFIEKCKNDPSYLGYFYYKKTSSQWNPPLYQCLTMNSLVINEQNTIVKLIYDSPTNTVEPFMNILQLLLYGGTLLCIIFELKNSHIEFYVLMIGILGGFLFSMLWEAKSRYIFPYVIMTIPYASIGIYITCSKIYLHFQHFITKQKEN